MKNTIETRKNAIENLEALIDASRIYFDIDYVKDDESIEDLHLSSLNNKSTTSAEMYDKVHVLEKKTDKQLFYIRTNSKSFKFVLRERYSNNLTDEAKALSSKFTKHNTDYCYFVSFDNAKAFLDAIMKAYETLDTSTKTDNSKAKTEAKAIKEAKAKTEADAKVTSNKKVTIAKAKTEAKATVRVKAKAKAN